MFMITHMQKPRSESVGLEVETDALTDTTDRITFPAKADGNECSLIVWLNEWVMV